MTNTEKMKACDPLALESPLLHLPPMVRTYDGAAFNPSEIVWRFECSHSLFSFNFSPLSYLISQELLRSFQLTLIWFLERESAAHASNCFDRTKRFFLHAHGGELQTLELITAAHILNYRATLDEPQEWLLGSIRGFLTKWYALKYPGVSADAVKALKELRLRRNEQGKAVLTYDVKKGPLTRLEFAGLTQALQNAHKAGQIDPEQHLLSRLAITFGARPAQICLLKVRDVVTEQNSAGEISYFLKIPQVKNKRASRSEFKLRPVKSALGRLLLAQVQRVTEKLRCEGFTPADAPLFPTYRGNPRRRLMRFHKTSGQVGGAIKAHLEKLRVVSERTGRVIDITATRLRRTFASRLAAEGYGVLIIADCLGHATTKTASVYVQAQPDIVERVDKATALVLGPIAKAFLGKVIDGEAEATRGGDPQSRIFDPRFTGTQGSCASYCRCNLVPPIACYTCTSFEPWRDGPHREVLDYLIASRDELANLNDDTLSQNLERTILACADVIERCKA